MKKKKIIAFIAALSCMVIAGCSNNVSSSSSSDGSSYVSTDSPSSEDGSSPSSSEPEPSSSGESSTPDSSEPDSSEPDSSEPDSSIPDSSEPDSSSPDSSEPDSSSSEPEPDSSSSEPEPDSSSSEPEPDSSSSEPEPDSSSSEPEPDSSSTEPDSSSSEPEPDSSSAEPIPEVEVSISGDAEMVTGRSQVVSVVVQNADDMSVTYSTGSGTSDVISVDADGNVIAVSAGTDTVIATSNEDSSKSASLSITVSDPVFDSSAIDITTNYTANIIAGDLSIAMVVNDQAWVLSVGEEAIGYWFDNGNVYSLNYDENGFYIDMNSPEADLTPDTVLAMFNMSTYVQASEWAFYSYENGVDSFVADSEQAITQFIGSMFTCDSVVIRNTDDEGVVLTLMYSGEVAATLSFENVGETAQSIDPEYRYFDEGGEAGDNDGAGEDW